VKGTGTITKKGSAIRGVLTFHVPEFGQPLVIHFTGSPAAADTGIYQLETDASAELLMLAQAAVRSHG